MSKLRTNEIAPYSAPGIGVGGTPTSPSAMWDFQSTTQGILPPRMTTAQRNGIVSPVEGLLIYNLDDGRLEQYSSGQWTVAGNGLSPAKNVLRVSKNTVLNAGDFSSVTAALASISDNSPTNPYAIVIEPGVYVESQIVTKPYVSIEGVDKVSVILTPLNPNANFILANDFGSLNFCTITGVTGSGKAAIYITDGTFQANNISFVGNSVGVKAEGISNSPTIVINNSTFSGIFANAVICKNNGQPARAVLKNSLVDATVATGTSLIVQGVSSDLVVSATSCQSSLNGTICVSLEDGATFQSSGFVVGNYTTAMSVPTGGSNPRISITGITFIDCTNDINVAHAGAFGTISGTIDEDKSTFNAGTIGNIAFLLLDPDGSVVISNELKQLQNDNSVTDISTLSRNSSAMGILSSGDISPPVSGFTVSAEAGFGYLQKSDGSVRKITWPDTNFTVSANSTTYLYFDATSTLQGSGSLPNNTENIVLGRVVSDSTGILIIEESGFLSTHASNGIGTALRNGLGAVYSEGSIVTEFGTRELTVTAGEYYYGERQFLSNGGSPITYTAFYQNGTGGFTTVLNQNTVDNAFYDNGTGTLAPLTSGYYAKHSIYALGDSTGDFDSEAYFLVYSQQQYTALTLAEQGSLPNPPAFLSEAVTLIASVIVQEGSTNIVEVRDERPLFAAKHVSGVAASTFHHNLLGLNDFDDHLRYLPVDGSRPMTGDLPMGTHNVTNAGTYNGVTVEAHESRHLPNGADPLTTAAPLTTLSPATTNATGTANSLARSDHTHAVATSLVGDITSVQAGVSASAGVVDKFARGDHKHNISTASVSSQTPDQSNAEGSSSSLARADHVHNIPTATAVGLDTTSTNTQGSNATFARSNHTHAIASGAPSSQTPDQANAAGSSVNFAKADHIHNIPTATAISVGTTNTQGSAATFSRADHSHQGIHSLAANSGSQRFGDQNLKNGNGITVVDDGAGNFTFDTIGGPNELVVTAGAGLVANYTTGKVRFDGTFTQVPAGTITLAASQTNGRIYVDTDGTVKQTAGGVLAPPYTVILALFTTGVSTITSITDHRTFLDPNIIRGLVTDIVTIVPNASAAQGSTNRLADAGHTHAIATAAATGLNANSTSTEGSATSFARSDHTHAIASGAASSQTPNQSNAVGTSTNFARADHVHNIPTGTPSTLNATNSNTQGTVAAFAQQDHLHAISTGAASTQTPDQSNATGTGANLARADHVHNIPSATATTVSSNANARGTAATFALSDHTHQLTATSASLDHVPQYDGSNWQATYPEALIPSGRTFRYTEDWINATSAGTLGWTAVLTGGASVATSTNTGVDANHPGVLVLTAGNAAARFADVHLGLTTMELGGGAVTIECLFNLQTLTNAAFRIGLGDQTAADHNNGVYLEFNSGVSATNWLIKTANGGTRTSTTTSVAATANAWHKLLITINAAATSVSFTLDGTNLGSIITNIPTTNAVSPNLMSDSLGATTTTMWIDYFTFYQRFTTPR